MSAPSVAEPYDFACRLSDLCLAFDSERKGIAADILSHIAQQVERGDVLREQLVDQCEMNEQSIKALTQLHKEWPHMIHEETYDGEPVISEALRCIVDDLATHQPRTVLART